MSILSHIREQKATSMTGLVLEGLKQTIGTDTSFKRQDLCEFALSTESIDGAERQAITNAADTLKHAIEALAAPGRVLHNGSAPITNSQKEAAVLAGLYATNPNKFFHSELKIQEPSANKGFEVMAYASEGLRERMTPALEAYDEKANRDVVINTITYNLSSARQDAFGEAFFPTIVVSNDQVGLGVQVRLMTVFDDQKRDISGAVTNFNKKNILRAVANPTILKTNQTKIVPVVRPESEDNFADSANVPTRDILVGSETVTTAPLAFGKEIGLLEISQLDSMLTAGGANDITDSIDPAVTLSNVYLKVGADVFNFNTENLALSNFVAAAQGMHRVSNLNFVTDGIVLTKNTVVLDETAPAGALSVIKTKKLTVRLSVKISGSINLELANLSVFANSVSVAAVFNEAGEQLPLDSGDGKTIADAIKTATFEGYDVSAWRTNLNRRQRGQLIDTAYFTQLWQVPLLSPITALKPLTDPGQDDGGNLATLVTLTQIMTSQSAVNELIKAASILKQYVEGAQGDIASVAPSVLGAGRLLVKPQYLSEKIDYDTDIDSLRSQDRIADLKAVMVNKLTDMAYRLHRDSEYEIASNARYGGQAPQPTAIIGTDPYLYQYLMRDGDLRTLGEQFKVKIVSSYNPAVRGRIFVAFGQFDGSENTSPNPLHFGTMAWKPELVTTLPISRNGQTSKELTVQPSYLHFVNCPIMGVLEVVNVPNVVASKVSIYTEEQAPPAGP